ncbi:hypothetical protein VTL71DRAFT_4062, partial [Oculimacula yallundae]
MDARDGLFAHCSADCRREADRLYWKRAWLCISPADHPDSRRLGLEGAKITMGLFSLHCSPLESDIRERHDRQVQSHDARHLIPCSLKSPSQIRTALCWRARLEQNPLPTHQLKTRLVFPR